MTKIVQKEDKVLRKVAVEVKKDDITSKKIEDILDKMRKALKKEEDGVALAAPQIGKSMRIFVVSPKVFAEIKPGIGNEKNEISKDIQTVFINPKITKKSKDKKLVDEGCLSLRWWYGKIRRASRVEVEALNEKGEKFKIAGTGLLAQIFQHETDHLDGILFTDNATDLVELPPNQEND